MMPRPHQRYGPHWPPNGIFGECIYLVKYNATLLFSTRDCQLFKLMRSSSHCLHHLLPAVRSVSYSLRQRGHPYERTTISISEN